jgi:hypothetical protein
VGFNFFLLEASSYPSSLQYGVGATDIQHNAPPMRERI